MRKTMFALLTAGLAALGCHTITEELPTQPTKAPATGVLTIPIPAVPGATPTPAPTPSANPTPTPEPSPTPTPTPDGSGCGDPIPPNLGRMEVKIHITGPNLTTLDSTPLVGPNREYCAKIGFTDGRSFCPVRAEGNPERVACETLVVGTAEDTGRSGPTWTRNGQYCTGDNGCENHPVNQYLLLAGSSGTYKACAGNGVCGLVEVVR
jgi:hypothetical protein